MSVQLELLWVGKPRDKLLAPLVERYLARLRRHRSVTLVTVPDAKSDRPEEACRLEAEALRTRLGRDRDPAGRRVVALDERGTLLSTREVADRLGKLPHEGVRRACFVIGGAEGLDPAFLREADEVWSLSRMTFTHELARVILLEQLYRAFSLLAGHPYHRE